LHLLENQHRVLYIGRPQKGFMDEWNSRIARELADTKAQMTEEARLALNERVTSFKKLAQEPKPVHLLPKLTRDDIDISGRYYLPDYDADGITVFRQPLAGLTHLRIEIQVPLGHRLLPWLGLASCLLGKLGAGDLDEEQFALYVEKYIGGFAPHTDVRNDINDPNLFQYFVVFPGYCLDDSIDHLLRAIRMVIETPHCNNLKVLETLVRMRYRTATQALTRDAGEFVKRRVMASCRPSHTLEELNHGLSAIAATHEIVEAGDWQAVSENLAVIVSEIIRKGRMRICVHVGSIEQQERVVGKLSEFLCDFNESFDESVPQALFEQMNEFSKHKRLFLQAETKSNFCGWAVPIGSYADPMSPVYSGLSDLLTKEYLHNSIRVQLGAYGARCTNENRKGILRMSSTRDSSVRRVLEAFGRALVDVTLNVTDEAVDNMVLRLFGSLDRPTAPQDRGLIHWHGAPVEVVQKRREIFYGITKEQIMEAAERVREIEPNVVVFSSEAIAGAPEGFEVTQLLMGRG
jgi:Zn-dependent M16 (insulinase) family peptidase